MVARPSSIAIYLAMIVKVYTFLSSNRNQYQQNSVTHLETFCSLFCSVILGARLGLGSNATIHEKGTVALYLMRTSTSHAHTFDTPTLPN